MRKKAVLVILTVCMVISLVACGKKESTAESSQPAVTVEETTPTATPKPTATTTPKPTATPEPTVTEEPIEAPTEEPTAAPEPTAEPEATETPEADADDGAIRTDVKAAIDSYEAFVDEYCEFMKSYDATDINMLSQYSEMLQKEADALKKFEAIEDEDLNDAELAYYTEVSLRCSQKMIDCAGALG